MKNIALLLMLCFLQTVSYAQIVGTDAYIKGTSVEIGIAGSGGFEGADIFTNPPPAGMHNRAGSSLFGFLANPQLNSWTTYNGDYFTPGSPENGWGFEIGVGGTVFGSNNCSGDLDVPGAITSYQHTGTCYNVDWEGDATSGTDLHFKVHYFLEETDLFYTTTISITNNTSATIPDMYYYRSVDPDNNEELNGSFETQNTIECQQGATGVSCVSATQPAGSGSDASYLGFAGIGSNYRVTYGGFSNRVASDIWNGTGATYTPPLVATAGSTSLADDAISLAYRIQNLAPGATATFKYVVILDVGAATNIITVSYPGSTPPQVCDTAIVDTIRNCGNPIPLQIHGSTVGNYTWTWSPAAGLSTTVGTSTVASPAVTTTYTATGVPASACVPPVPVTVHFVMQIIPGGAVPPVITPVSTICLGSSPITLHADSSGGVWSGTGITNASAGTFDPAVAGVGSDTIIYAIGTGPCQTADTTIITVSNSGNATITQPAPVCAGSAPFNLSAASTGGVWSGTGITDATNGTFDPTTAGSFIVTYTISGSCVASDTAIVTVNSVIAPVTSFSYPTSPVCTAGTNPIPQGVPGFTTGGTYTSTPGLSVNSTTGVINLGLSAAGTYTVTYHINATTCGPASTSTATITIIPLTPAITNFSYNSPFCSNDTNEVAQHIAGFTTGGTYSSTAGLVIIDSTGEINVAASIPGTYTVTYTVNGSNTLCTASGTNTTSVTINPLPSITISSDIAIYIGQSTDLFATGGSVYNWNPGTDLVCLNTDCDSLTANPTESTKYCVTVVDSVGCIDSSCVKVLVEIPCLTNRNLIVPNAFTPNADGVNDELCLNGWDDCVSTFQIFIYDRWGEKVFESVDPKFCWDGVYKGKLLDPAVFVYYIKATYRTEGATITAPKKTIEINKKGNISLVR